MYALVKLLVLVSSMDWTLQFLVESVHDDYRDQVGALDSLRQHHRVSRQSRACPSTEDGKREFLCPLSAHQGALFCIDDHDLCNGLWDCPNREDENTVMCMFYRIVQAQIRSVTQIALEPRGRRLSRTWVES